MVLIEIESIALIIALGGLALGIINSLINYLQHRRMNLSMKIPIKKRLFREWYEITKDIVDRIEITERRERENSLVYLYKLRKKDGTDFESQVQQKTLIKRYLNALRNVKNICEYKSNTSMDQGPPSRKILSDKAIIFPNDMVPENIQEIKDNLLNQIILMARENGIKKRHLIK